MPIGYRVVSYNLSALKATTLMERKPVDLTPGAVHHFNGGLYLGTNEAFTQYYLGATDDHDVILAFEFDEADIIAGDLSPNSEILVKKGVLREARFEDQAIQERFGHLLNPEFNTERRERNRGQCLRDLHGLKRTAVIRAMDNRVGHLHPMDYVYCIEHGAFHAVSKRVMKAYENGDPLSRPIERMMLKTLEHAVTTAIYEGEPQQVSYAVISNHHLYQAPNTGEFFFDADTPAKVTKLFEIDAQGTVNVVRPEQNLEMDH